MQDKIMKAYKEVNSNINIFFKKHNNDDDLSYRTEKELLQFF